MIVRSKLEVFKKEFPGLDKVLLGLHWRYQKKQGKGFRTQDAWEEHLSQFGEMKVKRADLVLLERRGDETPGLSGKSITLFAIIAGFCENWATPDRLERTVSFSWFRPWTWFGRTRWIDGETVRDLILRSTDPSVVFEVQVDGWGIKHTVIIHKPRKGMTLQQLAENQEQLAQLEVREEIEQVDVE